ncbi:MAG: SNF2 family DNA or RNA helicase [Saprospiraceae bacterium]|jgi:non-specific serine/threonine protein kinase
MNKKDKILIPENHVNQLRKARSTLFYKQIVARGKRIYIDRGVGDIMYNYGISAYETSVRGSMMYRVTIKMSAVDSVPFLICNCPFDENCKHQVAVIEKLLREGNLETKEKESASKPHKKAIIEPPVRLKEIKNSSANNWRVVPGLDNISTVPLAIRTHSAKNDDYYGTIDCDIIVNPNDSFILSYTKNGYSYYSITEGEIEVKKEGNQILVRCKSCSRSSNKFCSHQAMALQHVVDDFLLPLIKGEFQSYKELKQLTANKLKLRDDQVEKYYKIVLKNNMVACVPKHDGFINNFVADSFAKNEEAYKKENFTKHLDQLSKFGYALLWNEEGVEIITGKLNKAKTKLSSNIDYVYENKVLDNDLRGFKYEFDYNEHYFQIGAIIEFIKKNIDLIYNRINFLNTSSHGLRKSDLVLLTIEKEIIKSRVIFSQDGTITVVKAEFFINDRIIPFESVRTFLPWFLLLKNGRVHFFNNEYGYKLFSLFFSSNGEIVITRDVSLKSPIYTLLANADEVIKDGFDEEELIGGKKGMYLNKTGEYITFTPKLTYDKEKFDILNSGVARDIATNSNLIANIDEINVFKSELRDLFSNYDFEITEQMPIIINESVIMNNKKFMKIIEYSAEHDIEILGDEGILFTKYTSKKPTFNIIFSSGIDWFDSNIEIAYGDINVTPNQWVEAVKENRNYVVLSDGKHGILPEKWLKKLKRLSAVGEVDKKGTIKINKLKFNVLDEMFEDIDDDVLKDEIHQKKEALANYEKNKSYSLPRGLKAKLRPYQKQGYQWLKFLEEYKFGGCLADDMGLGKTIQVLTLLLNQKNAKKGSSFIVVPRSLLFNWQAEIEKFTPTLKAHIHHGVNRNLEIRDLKKIDLVITTYDTCVRDIELFSEHVFNYIILDESQAIKNPNSQRYKAMRLLKADHRLVMTGTPIENNTLDIYAQFSFINPGLLGSLNSFKNKFARKIDIENDVEATETLKKLMHPFILRRKKEHVAKDLPKKTESILYCEMDKTQRAMYEELKNAIRTDINSSIEKDGVNKSKFKILDGLLRLRQMCNATQLTSKLLPEAKKRSVKIDMLLERIQELGSHKALVFSQFVGMLSLVRERLDAEGIKYAYLDGSTRDRQKAVSDFMDNDDINLFLISIKAGNSGLNLTKADYVYILDPWWNPAIEAQAIDRTHRIGQQKPIFAYKMICKDTIEEKIVKLQAKKKKLASDLIQVDENVFKSLEKDDLMALFD